MTFFTGIANAGLTAFNPEYYNMKMQIEAIGENAKMRGLIAIVVGVALAVLGILIIMGGSAGGLFPLLLSAPCLWAGLNNLKMGDNIKQVAINPLDYLDERTCFAKLSEGTVLFDFAARDFTRGILYGRR